MTQLRSQILSLRRQPADDDRHYIPHKPLYRLMTRDAVFDAAKGCGQIPLYHLDRIVDRIVKGGRRVFAILILREKEGFVSRFIEHDQLQNSQLDAQLPLSFETLRLIVPEIVDDFYEKQWEFVAPIFSRDVVHRFLPKETRLPFTSDKVIGSGGFGVVSEIKLDQDHQRLPLLPHVDQRIARKEFKLQNDDSCDHEIELHNLILLNDLKHPNITELLCSYTYRGKHNFLFPLAHGGDLATFLTQQDRPPSFQSDETFFTALSELSSAIDKVHDYTSARLNLSLIGCHHDLKPKNILVDRHTFVLADFGLSRFKKATESSKSRFERGEGHYLAPECEDYEGSFEKHTISRPSDIWSFGCIIAEVYTYMKTGADGVKSFKLRREVTIENFKTFTFHKNKQQNDGVNTWLSGLECQSDRSGLMLTQLIRCMLSMTPDDRPKSQQVTSRLRFIAVSKHIDLLGESYHVLSEATDSFEAHIEWVRFKSWKWTFESVKLENDRWNYKMDTDLNLKSILQQLIGIGDELESIIYRVQDALSPLFTNLRLFNDRLLNLLPRELQDRARTHLELELVCTEDQRLLEKTQRAFGETSPDRRIGMLATIKRMSLLVSSRQGEYNENMFLKQHLVHQVDQFGGYSTAMIREAPELPEKRVLVEWIQYDTHWEGPVSEKMFKRVEAIAKLLNSLSKPSNFRVLHCCKFFHDKSRAAFGLLYDFPYSCPSARTLNPRNLATILSTTRNLREKPSLGDRFKLAYDLAVTILEFHKVGWMHKNISAQNVVFFNADGSQESEWLREPYVIGFDRSRPDDPAAFTDGLDRFKSYQHPRYSTNLEQPTPQRYRPDFDYYSLGIVLLEIGLWRTLGDMIKHGDNWGPLEIQEHIVNKRMFHLVHSMGTGYYGAVRDCLNQEGGFGVPMDLDCTAKEITSLHLSFERLVIEPLSRCSA
ncbi:MAG: hypothetical protein M1839_000764 [Geoglossum umbratile]|nr:MAG: hypothetical protein M1839_000764 [Geoglossum umbratile]